ncbi:hypothetical protein [Roseixanthobacter pseudopolyaromaticivorans]|uniref:hypothetical protein n=1 Tax=Xanthobacteraceae TaxID=335928 RepID=UPI00372BE4AB
MKPLFQTLLVLALLICSVGLLLHLADDRAHLCDFALPAGGIGCYLRQYGDLAGGLLGAAGTIFAGWIAWLGVQGQIAKGEIAFLHNQREATTEALYGLNFLKSILDDWLTAFAGADANGQPYPNITTLRRAQKRGMLEKMNFAPSAGTFLAWNLARELLKLRTAFAHVSAPLSDAEMREAEQFIGEALESLRETRVQVVESIAREEKNLADISTRIYRQLT